MNDYTDVLTLGQTALLMNRTEDVIRDLVASGQLVGESGADGQLMVSRDSILAYQSDERVRRQARTDHHYESIDDVLLEGEVIEGKRRGRVSHSQGIA